eukprot:TRINITY_DN9903_c1_g1_i1.p1 TRINITY_DN9903_c1_g1~~TRINITY_DN9903_c1_g1_i1.p1  ORF type:complete len:307 (+),score=33.43 TRINITY_DN9903_c1_g1_i1:85-1005(+)
MDDEGSMVLFRVAAMAAIFGVKIVFGSAPLYFRTNLRFLSIANAFAAGVFLAGGLVHLLPEAVEAFGKLEGAHHHHHENHEHHCEGKSEPYILCAVGFMMTFYLEKVLLAKPAKDEDAPHAHDEEAGGDRVTYHGHSHGFEQDIIYKFTSGETSMMPIVLTAVLSVHSVVSGMALGIQTEWGKALLVFLAIISHKWVEAFSLGTNIVKSTGADTVVLRRLLTAFAISSPFGILIGWFLEASLKGPTASTVTAYLDAAASGTFLYIAVVDTLTEEFSNGRDSNRKFAAVLLGFAMMRTLSTLVVHQH